MPDLQVYVDALTDKRFVGQWNAARYGKLLKYAVERRYIEEIIQRPGPRQSPPPLLSVTPESIQLTALAAAAAGVSFNPSLCYAYIVPYAGKATFALGYRGIVHLALKCGLVRDVQAVLVHAQDPVFRVSTGPDGRRIEHEESRALQRGDVTHSYSVTRYMNGGQHIEVMDIAELNEIEKAAKVKGGMVWNGPFRGEMQKKAPVRRSSKWWPIDPDSQLAHALAVADQHDPLVDFDRAETPAGGEVVITGDQALQLHANLVERGIDAKRASDWLLKTAQARGYARIEQLPQSKFDDVLLSLTERAKVFLTQAQKGEPR